MRLPCKLLVCMIALWQLVLPLSAAPSPESSKNVLVLYPERPDLPAQLILDGSIRAHLSAIVSVHIDFYTEHMEVSRFPGEDYLRSLHNFYRQKYAGRKMDLVIAVTRRPLEFLLKYQEELFPHTPQVFCGVDSDTLQHLPLHANLTGIVRHLDFKGTLELALGLHPQTRHVVLLSGTSPTDDYFKNLAWSQLRHYEGRVEFIELGALPMPELLDRVSQLPPQTIILYLTFFRDGAGKPFTGRESASLLAQMANAPLYSVFDTLLGYGAVGGHMFSHETLGVQVAELSGRILNGEKPEAFPLLRTSSNAYLFDWPQLQRWQIPEDQLPPGSQVRDKNPSTWQRYRGYILGSGLLCSLETVLIVGLLVQRKRRRQVERWLAERLRIETLCADLSGTFLNLASNDNLDKVIFYGLQRVTEFLGADRGSLTEFVKATETFRVTHSWAIEGIDPLPSGPIIGQYPWCADTLLRGGIIRCATLHDLTEAAAIDREAFRKVGTRSVMVVPLTAGDTMLGSLSVGTVRAERAWTDEQVQGLRSLGEIFANALLHQRAERAVRDSEALRSAVLASLQGLVAVIDKTGVIIAVNGAWSHFARDHHPNPLASISVGANYLDACRRAAFDNDPRTLEAVVAIESVLHGAREEFVLEYSCATPGGEAWYVMSVEQLRRSEGGAVITHRDITDHRRAEIAIQRHYQELAHVSRVAMMGELAVSLAHELNQPLTAILSNAQAAQRFLSAASPALDEVHSILADIVEDDQRAGEVIHRLRGLLKKGEVELLPLSLNQVIQEVIRLLHSDAIIRHVRIELELDAGLPQVWGDRVQLQQVVLNLMLNGFDAMVDRDPNEREMVVRTQQLDADTALVAVQDCGSGIAADKLERIFEPFYTTKVEGLGMGLSICRSIVAGHGGRLWAENNPHRGTTVSFTLPVGEGEQ